MKYAILVDGGYYRAQWRQQNNSRLVPNITDLMSAIDRIKADVEQHHAGIRLLRTYYYDTDPFSEVVVQPDGTARDFSISSECTYQLKLLSELAMSDSVAIRRGQLKFRSWETASGGRVRPIFAQKGVDMKIGLDVAWMATKRLVDVIILVTEDADFIAPMKLARTEGVEVWLYTLQKPAVKHLVEHSDIHKCLQL